MSGGAAGASCIVRCLCLWACTTAHCSQLCAWHAARGRQPGHAVAVVPAAAAEAIARGRRPRRARCCGAAPASSPLWNSCGPPHLDLPLLLPCGGREGCLHSRRYNPCRRASRDCQHGNASLRRQLKQSTDDGEMLTVEAKLASRHGQCASALQSLRSRDDSVEPAAQAVAEAEVAALLNIHETVAALADEKRALLTALTAQRVRCHAATDMASCAGSTYSRFAHSRMLIRLRHLLSACCVPL